MKVLNLENVTFATNKHYNCLNNINFSLEKGEQTLLFSDSNSGAIELFRVMIGLEKFQGNIKYNNLDLQKLNYKNMQILYIPKSPVFFENKSIEFNIKFFLKLREKNKKRVKENLEKVLKKYGLDGIKEEKVKNLSKIERLKICFARSYFREIDLLLIENIFHNLTQENICELVCLIKNFIIEHCSAAFIWISDKKLIKFFENYKTYKLEYGTLSIMP